MKILKLLIVIQLIFTLSSCNEDKSLLEESSLDQASTLDEINSRLKELESEIGKNVTIYTEGCTKNENLVEKDDQKIETDAPEEYINLLSKKNKFIKSNFIPKRKVKSTSNIMVGVIANTTGCGSYDEITIFMDTEDRGTNDSKLSGWFGASYKDSHRNVGIRFCIVPAEGFRKYNNADYMLLKIGYNTLENTKTVLRHFDSEDHHVDNRFYKNRTKLSDGELLKQYPPNKMYKDINLYFHLFYTDRVNGMTEFPNKRGIEYGVIGTIPNRKHGFIFTDDEDKKCDNHFEINGVKCASSTYFPGLIEFDGGGRNTKIKISKVK